MSLHKLTAGDGYTYLIRQVAAADAVARGYGSLGDYYSQKGEAPGLWIGAGVADIGVTGVVSEAQMLALFGEGRHPDADTVERAVLAAGGSQREAGAASKLGRKFPVYADQPSPRSGTARTPRAYSSVIATALRSTLTSRPGQRGQSPRLRLEPQPWPTR